MAAKEVGLDPTTVSIIATCRRSPCPVSGLVGPVLAWSAQLGFTGSTNPAEVTHVCTVVLNDLGRRVGDSKHDPSGEGHADDE